MTPAITLLTRHKISHKVIEFGHDPNATSYGLEAAEKLAVDPACVFKTLICTLNTRQHVVAVLPVSHQLSLKKLAQSAGTKKAAMAGLSLIPGITGYLPAVSAPWHRKKRFPPLSIPRPPALNIFMSVAVKGVWIFA